MDSLEEFMKRYNETQGRKRQPNNKQQGDERRKRAEDAVEEYIRRLKQKRRKEK